MSTSEVAAPQPGAGGAATTPLLSVENVEVIYDQVILVLRGLSLTVPNGQIVALLGSNGAGKSTTLKAIAGLLPTEHGEVTDGAVRFDGADITRVDAAQRVRRGVALVMEGRRVFEHLTVHENLVAGGYTRGNRADYERIYEFLPRLATLRSRVAGYLSGGEQQMLAIGRALMSDPRLLMLDEPSLGLAPRMVDEVFTFIQRLNAELGLTALLVEQNARRALAIAHRGYIMESGRIVLDGAASELADNPDVKEFYLGLGEAGARKRYRDVKHYKRRKRWL
ncbi:ABC transporter ATP-binding protein [Micromonospora sp. DT47]|uniref:ABC transporter ATP-binding protein n=1 Tax=Micromonospora sp. DT47 TaxID=3393431 RepID=UPI003CEE427C